MGHLWLPVLLIALPVLISFTTRRRMRHAVAALKAGVPTSIPVRVAGGSGPYPVKLSSARLTRTSAGGAALLRVAPTGSTILVDPPGFLLRSTTNEFRGRTRMPANEQAYAMNCVDPAGNEVLLAVRASYLPALALMIDSQTPSPGVDLEAVVAATDEAPARRRLRRPGPIFWALTAPLLVVLMFGLGALTSRPVTAVVTANDGGGSCSVEYNGGYATGTAEDTTSCDASLQAGAHMRLSDVAGLGVGDFGNSSDLTSYVLMCLAAAALAAIPLVVLLWRRWRFGRSVVAADGSRDQRVVRVRAPDLAVAGPGENGESCVPADTDVPELPEDFVYSSVVDLVRRRAEREDWAGTSPGKRALPARIRAWRPPWGLALLRLTSLIFPVCFLIVIPLIAGIPAYEGLRAVHAGPTLVATATVEPGSCDSQLPFVPPTATVHFVAAGGTVTASVTPSSCPHSDTVAIRYAEADPSKALLVDGDASARMAVTALVAFLAGLLWIGWRIRKVATPVVRLRRLARDPSAARPFRYVRTRTPEGLDVLLLFSPLGDEPPNWVVGLAAPFDDAQPNDGFVRVVEGRASRGERYLMPLGERGPMWPDGAAAPAAAVDMPSLVDPSAALTAAVRDVAAGSDEPMP